MTQLVRIPLAWPIGTRSGTSLAKDPYIKNGFLEKYGDKLHVAKRPGTEGITSFGPGLNNQGVFYFNGFFYAVIDDILYRSSGSSSGGTTGSAWTQATTPTWPATELQNAIVFKDRIFMIGGVASAAGIWSTQDGLTWAVNSGGQPWGLRDQQGLVVFQNQMWILGGFNITLSSSFNDIWSTPDGTNWTNIVVDGAPNLWPERCAHCAVAANNGIYIYGGLDTGTVTYFNDVWYSPDGENWQELTSAAPWTARSSALSFWFDNKLWIVGGIDGGGTALNDAWSSHDGITWTQTTAAAFAGGRFDMYGCVYAGKMWAIGGMDALSPLSDVYSSSDGIAWTLVTSGPNWSARNKGQAVVFKTPTSVSPYRYESMWILGGDNGVATLREVWYGNLDAPLSSSYPLTPTTPSQPFQFATYMNGTKLLIKNQSNFWVLDSGELTEVVDLNYPPVTVPGLVVLNAFAYVMTPGGEIHACQLDDPLTWPSLSFLTADYEDDPGIALAKYLNYVVAFGQYTTQFFYDNGANQPEGIALAPYITANLTTGIVVAQSVANVDNSLYFIAQTKNGDRTVMRLVGLQMERISTAYIEKVVMVAPLSFMQGFNFSVGGHQYYVLKTATLEALVYDVDEREWYEWDAFPYQDAITDFFTEGSYLFSASPYSPQLVRAEMSNGADALGGTFTFSCQTDKIDHGNMALKFCGRATLVGDVSAAQPSIAYTDDDYQTYRTAGTVRMTSARPFLTRLGSFRRRAWKVSQADANTARWEALEVEYSQGES